MDTDGDGTSEVIIPVAGTQIDVYQDVNGTVTLIGTIEIDPETGESEFIPELSFVGTAVIPYTATDETDEDTATMYYTVSNDTNAENDITQTPVNVPVSGNVLTNDTDKQGDSQTVDSATGLDMNGDPINIPVDGTATPLYTEDPDNPGTYIYAGMIEMDADGSYTFVPDTDFTGSIPVEYVAKDSKGAKAEATLDIDVIPTDDPDSNEPPVANDDTNTTDQGVAVSDNVIDPNDSDPDTDQDDLEVTQFTYLDMNGVEQTQTVPTDGSPTSAVNIYDENRALAGTLIMDNTGDYTFTPTATYVGEVPVDYTIIDDEDDDNIADGGSSEANLTITVASDPNGTRNNTYANDDASTGEPGASQVMNILSNDHDPEGDDQDVQSMLVDSDGDGTPEVITPVAGTQTDVYMDTDNNPITPSELIGTIEVDPETGVSEFIPELSFVGTAVIPYTATDGTDEDTATMYFTVPNDTNAENDIAQTPINVPVSGNVLTNDTDNQGDSQIIDSATGLDMNGDPVTIPVDGTSTPLYTEDPDNPGTYILAGTIEMNADGSYTYTPETDFTGSIPVKYVAEDSKGAKAKATLDIDVIPIDDPDSNEPPVANDDTNTTDQGVAVSNNVIDPNDKDPDTDQDDLKVTEIRYLDMSGAEQTLAVPINGSPTSAVNIYDENRALAGTFTMDNTGAYVFTPTSTYVERGAGRLYNYR